MNIISPAQYGRLHYPYVRTRNNQATMYTDMVHQGIAVLTNELITTAPEYFNFYTKRGRAALVAAHLIAGGEITGVLPNVVKNPKLLYDYLGGAGNRMRGWAQFNLNYFNPYSSNASTRMKFDAFSYNLKMGRILYGIDPKPTGKGYFNIDKFADLLESGTLRTTEEIRQYLAREFSIRDWQGLHHSGGGAQRIGTHRLGEKSLEIVYNQQVPQKGDYVQVARVVTPPNKTSVLSSPSSIMRFAAYPPAPLPPHALQQTQNTKQPSRISNLEAVHNLQPILVNHQLSDPPISQIPVAEPPISQLPVTKPQTYGLFQKLKHNNQIVYRGQITLHNGQITHIKSTLYRVTKEKLLSFDHQELSTYYIKASNNEIYPITKVINPPVIASSDSPVLTINIINDQNIGEHNPSYPEYPTAQNATAQEE